MQEGGGADQDSTQDTNLDDCFNYSTCLLIDLQPYGRSGNLLMQLRAVEYLLSSCSGAAIDKTPSKDSIVRFPSLQIFGKPSCRPRWDKLSDIEHIFANFHARCKRFEFAWYGKYPGIKCKSLSAAEYASLQPERVAPNFPYHSKLHLHPAFPYWIAVDLAAWALPLPNTTAVLHFRGGDVFARPPHARYTQPVCDHYLQAVRHSGSTCALIVAEDNRNPCVAAVERGLACHSRPLKCNAACAFTLIARARIVVASFSSFLNQSLFAFEGEGRRAYFPYCDQCPALEHGVTTMCTRTDGAGLFPWRAGPRQLELLAARNATVVDCNAPPPTPSVASSA